jgi:hypothetical protein
METISYLAAAFGFVVVTGYAVLNWLRRGRDPHVTDDASILLAEPPEGMTAATATIVDHQPTAIAFMAALLDLASRDEIRFRAESDGGLVGIELHGGDSGDPQPTTSFTGERWIGSWSSPSSWATPAFPALRWRWSMASGRRCPASPAARARPTSPAESCSPLAVAVFDFARSIVSTS